ncbi:MAG: DoxX family protein [Candidatus Woesearchaeota archaeon]
MVNSGYGATLLRLVLGLLFVVPGIDKLLGMISGGHMLAGMLGVPLTWLVLLSEIAFGIAILIGFQLKYTVWPLVIILAAAIIMVNLPNATSVMGWLDVLFHLLGIAALISLYLTGPGKIAVDES